MAGRQGGRQQSIETILNFDNRDAQSDWSTVWSTTHIPGMDNAAGGRGHRRHLTGRRRLRIGALALGGFLSMHCQIVASTLNGGYLLFMAFLVGAVAVLANPLRHFEVYLGQWSISGPGRAFRIIPMLDGVGLAICINTVIRAINCCTVAAIAALYVMHSVADAKLPFTYCRDMELKPYEPIVSDISVLRKQGSYQYESALEASYYYDETLRSTRRNYTRYRGKRHNVVLVEASPKVLLCRESHHNAAPMHRTPAYNFFFIEIVQLRPYYSFKQFNITLVISIIFAWLFIWLCIIIEKISHSRLIWNNVTPWFVLVPWVWSLLVITVAICNAKDMQKTFRKAFHIGAQELFSALTDSLEVAMYIHSASSGTEHILGKGLNHYAHGHVDPHFNNENVWHSSILILLTVLHTGGGTICSLVDYVKPNMENIYDIDESTLWVLPMYSKCTAVGEYSHLMTALIFSGLMFSYLAVTYYYIKTALHTIFEYRVKLVFAEQFVVAALIITCLGCSLIFSTSGGILLLESVNTIMTGISMPFVCLLELICLIYLYRSRDFLSDMNLSTEENACSNRISIQWQIIPFITCALLVSKIVMLARSSLPNVFIFMGLAPLAGVVLAVPIRACHNAYVFLRPAPRLGT